MSEAFNQDLDAALRYDATESDVDNLIKQMRTDPQHLQAGATHRLVTADALQEQGREAEANLLRSPHPVYVWSGKVYHAAGDTKRADDFRRSYIASALRMIDNHDYETDNLHPDTLAEMGADADHFYHSNHDLIGERPYSSGDEFWGVRNRLWSHWGYYHRSDLFNGHGPDLEADAEKAGPYLLTATKGADDHRDEVFAGESQGVADWGQPAGLAEAQ